MKEHLAGMRIAILSAGVIASVPVLSLHAADPLGGAQADFGEAVSGLSIQIGRTFAEARAARAKREPARATTPPASSPRWPHRWE